MPPQRWDVLFPRRAGMPTSDCRELLGAHVQRFVGVRLALAGLAPRGADPHLHQAKLVWGRREAPRLRRDRCRWRLGLLRRRRLGPRGLRRRLARRCPRRWNPLALLRSSLGGLGGSPGGGNPRLKVGSLVPRVPVGSLGPRGPVLGGRRRGGLRPHTWTRLRWRRRLRTPALHHVGSPGRPRMRPGHRCRRRRDGRRAGAPPPLRLRHHPLRNLLRRRRRWRLAWLGRRRLCGLGLPPLRSARLGRWRRCPLRRARPRGHARWRARRLLHHHWHRLR